MPSLGIKPTAIALFPTAADRSTLTNAHQQFYLSPPLTPFPHFPSYKDQPESVPQHLSSYHPSLPALQEMLPHEKRQRNQSNGSDHHHPNSALQQPSEREIKEMMEHNSGSTFRGGQHMTDPARLLPLYTAQSPNAVPQSSTIISPLLRRNKAHVASACVNCKKAHLACDGNCPPHLFLFRLSIDVFLSSFLPNHACNQAAFATECGCMSSGGCAQRPNFRIISFFLLFMWWILIGVKGRG
jgi:hypothetical protein